MSRGASFVLVGGGIAAARAIEGLRAEGRDEPIILIGREPVLPYDRPPLSKAVLAGAEASDSTTLHDESWYVGNGVELVLGTDVTALDLANRRVEVAGGSTIDYRGLLLATGSTPRRLDLPGADLTGVVTLRTDEDAAQLHTRLSMGEPVVIVGGGWIGLEVAAAARGHGCPVTVIEPQTTVLAGALGTVIGDLMRDVHEAHGVEFRFVDQAERLVDDGTDSVAAVVTASGATLPARTVVVGIGITPNVDLAADAGLAIENGIRCNASLRTSAPDVFAAGDVASWEHPVVGTRIRVDHWTNASVGGQVAGRVMAGASAVHDSWPIFFSDQYDLGLEYVGHVPRGTSVDVVLRGDPRSGEYLAFWLSGDRLLAGMHVNTWGALDQITPLLGMPSVDRAVLADADTALEAARRPNAG